MASPRASRAALVSYSVGLGIVDSLFRRDKGLAASKPYHTGKIATRRGFSQSNEGL